MNNEKMERIHLEDYIQTGEGGTALTYNHKNGKTLAKLFMPSMAADTAVREFHINEVVYDSGLPTPKPIRLVTDGERFASSRKSPTSWLRCLSASPPWPDRSTRRLLTPSDCPT